MQSVDYGNFVVPLTLELTYLILTVIILMILKFKERKHE
jgi:hypothetical protein